MARLSTYLKNLLMIVILVLLLPLVFKGLRKYYVDATERKTKVGIITINGSISDGGAYIPYLKRFFNDPQIKAIVLKIESPGGASGTAQAVFQEINDLRKQHMKTVIAFSENYCTSAAYYIAAAADHIITQPATLVANIGVYIAYPNFQDFIKPLGIKYMAIESGTYKTGALMFKDLTPDQQAMFQSLTDDTYAQFVHDVAQRRPKVASVDPKIWANGRTFTGKQALELGLVDELGSHSALIQALRTKAPVEGEIVWVHTPRPSFFSKIFGTEEQSSEDGETHLKGLLQSAFKTLMEMCLRPVGP